MNKTIFILLILFNYSFCIEYSLLKLSYNGFNESTTYYKSNIIKCPRSNEICEEILINTVKLTKIHRNFLDESCKTNSFYAYNGNIKEIESYSFNKSHIIKDLYLRHNKITNLRKFTFFELKLEVLDLTYNKISTIEDNAFYNITVSNIFFNNNHIIAINGNEFMYLYNLNFLDLSDNYIRKLTKNFFKLSLSGNFSKVKISFRNNVINIVEDDAFIFIKHIEHLDLIRNKISYINEKAFNLLDLNRTRLYFSNNLLKEVPKTIYEQNLFILDCRETCLNEDNADMIRNWSILNNYNFLYTKANCENSSKFLKFSWINLIIVLIVFK